MTKFIIFANGALNLNNVVDFYFGKQYISYTPCYGYIAGGYAPKIAEGSESEMEHLRVKLIEFFSNGDTTFNVINILNKIRMN